MNQSPAAHYRIKKGGTVTLIISLGPEPKEKVMEQLEGVSEQDAKAFLNDLKINLTILVHTENSSTVPAGCVTRSDPAEGERLENGQTVHLYVSTGPVKHTAKVPNVVGWSLDMATKMLDGSNFENVTFEPIDSDQEEGIIVRQSVDAGLEVDVTTSIILWVSKGNQTAPPVTEPPAPTEPDTYVDKVVVIELPEELKADALLSVWRGQEIVDQRNLYAGTFQVEMKLRGEGVMTFTVVLDDKMDEAWTIDVDFGTGT